MFDDATQRRGASRAEREMVFVLSELDMMFSVPKILMSFLIARFQIESSLRCKEFCLFYCLLLFGNKVKGQSLCMCYCTGSKMFLCVCVHSRKQGSVEHSYSIVVVVVVVSTFV